MANVFDVAAYILKQKGPMTAMKLQKLLYYSQAWSLVWDEKPIFPERIEAWANGPVVPELYDWHRGLFKLTKIALAGTRTFSRANTRETLDAVLSAYGDQTSQWLSDLTHSEEPWKSARKGLAPGQWGRREISHAAMAEYTAHCSGRMVRKTKWKTTRTHRNEFRLSRNSSTWRRIHRGASARC